MKLEIKTPQLPESVADATVAAWRKQPGDAVDRGEIIGELETDKVALELPAPESGILVSIAEKAGTQVVSGQLLATIDTSATGASTAPVASATSAAAEAPSASAAAMSSSSASPPASSVPVVAPAARQLVREHKLDTTQITGTGKRGIILKADVLKFLDHQNNATTAPATPESAPPASQPVAANPPATATSEPASLDQRGDKRVPMTRLRIRTAERLIQSKNEMAALTTFNEVNMAPVMALRKKFGEEFLKQHGVKLGFMSLFTHACIEALRVHPLLNASIDQQDIIYHSYFDIGIAISSPRGLVVPIIRNADQLTLAQIEKKILDYGDKAKNAKLTLDDLMGGTFSITNGGVFGSMLSTPLINPPQTAILGMHAIRQRAVVEDDQIVIRPIMQLALTYDHRLIDGRDAVHFLVRVKQSLEEPARLILNL